MRKDENTNDITKKGLGIHFVIFLFVVAIIIASCVTLNNTGLLKFDSIPLTNTTKKKAEL